MADDTALLALAASVSDGVPIDWDAAESAATSADDLRLVKTLRLIATVGGVHRTDAGDDEPTPAAARPVVAPAQAVPHWGHFALLELIGEGTQGEVFRAIDTKLDRAVALKFLRRAPSDDVATVLREARLLARVRHPNVVTVYGADVIDGRVGMWMELIEGDTLEAMVQRAGPMSAAETAVVGMDVCKALATVHAVGLLHGDVKAQNVMREAGGRYVLMDFGVGREAVDARHGGAAGTPLCLAPEILFGEAASVRSDVYGVGVLLYYLATGTYPVTARSVAELRAQHRQGDRRSLTEIRPDLSRGFVDAIERATSANPATRPASASALADVLAATLSPAAPTATERPSRRRALMWAAACAVVLALIWGLTARDSVRPNGGSLSAATVAVLPFDDLSPDRSIAHVAYGLTDVLTTALGSRTRLHVIARTTAQAFVGPRRSLDLAREAGVDTLVEGSVDLAQSAVTTSVRIVDARTNRAVWSASFGGDLSATGAVAEKIVAAVAAHLSATLSPVAARSSWPTDSAALEAYFRGWGEYWRLSREGFTEAIRLFAVVREKAPNFAEGHAAYAYVRLTHELSNRGPDYDHVVREVAASADEALRLDPDSSLATATTGWLAFYADWDWPRAEALLSRAVSLNPSDPQVRWMYTQLLMASNRLDGALEEARLARRLDPLNPTRHANVGTVLYYARRYDDAIAEMRRVLSVDPNAAHARFSIARMFSGLGKDDEALTWLKGASHLHEPFVQAELARLLIRTKHQESTGVVAKLEQDYRQGRLAADYLAFVRLAQGDTEGAITLLQIAVAERSGTVIWIFVDPRFDALRDDPRFGALLRQLKLTPSPPPAR